MPHPAVEEVEVLDALSEIRSQDDDHIDVLVDEKIEPGFRSFLGLTKIRKVTSAAIQLASAGDRVAVIVVRAASKQVSRVTRFMKLGKESTFLTRGEFQPKTEIRGRKEKTVSNPAPAKAISYDANNLPPLSADARALLDRINRQAIARLEQNPAQQVSGKITTKSRAPLGFTSKYQKSVVSK